MTKTRRIFLSLLIAATAASPLLMTGCGSASSASNPSGDLSNTLGKGGSTLSNLLEGILTKTNLEVKDLAGTFEATGSAVSFKSENALQKAGGVAAAAAIEAQLDPYYKKYGLTGAVFTADADGNFSLKVKKINLKGVILKNEDGTFEFVFQAFNAIQMGSMTAYVQKSPTGLEIMFDATKLKDMLSMVSGMMGGTLTSTVSKVLDSYDGACMGFKFKKTGAAPKSSTSTSTEQSNGVSSLIDLLQKNK